MKKSHRQARKPRSNKDINAEYTYLMGLGEQPERSPRISSSKNGSTHNHKTVSEPKSSRRF